MIQANWTALQATARTAKETCSRNYPHLQHLFAPIFLQIDQLCALAIPATQVELDNRRWQWIAIESSLLSTIDQDMLSRALSRKLGGGA